MQKASLPFTPLKEKGKPVQPLAVMRNAIWVSEGMGRVKMEARF